MKRLKILTVFGTRPEAIKMAPLIRVLNEQAEFICKVCVTAQHREMLDQALEIFGILPDYDLNIMKHRQTLTDITIGALTGLQEVIARERPDLVLVHGDTTTTFAGALASYYEKTKLGHVEAGLRTYDKYQPYPEEMNRKLTTALTDLHFAPTETAKAKLLKENVNDDSIFITGNTVIDCLDLTVQEEYKFKEKELNEIDYKNKKVIAMTAHRRENLGLPLENICKAVARIATDFSDIEVVYAVHRNPAVLETAEKFLKNIPGVHLTAPLDMEDMHNLIKRSYLVLTDSGGLQEEAPSLDKPVLVLRNVTERPEGLEAGTLMLAGMEEEKIYESCTKLIKDASLYDKMARARNPFGDGKASQRIAQAILYHFRMTSQRPEEFSL